MMAYLLGRSLVGIRAEDILVSARWLAETCAVDRVDLQASSWAVTPALHAAVVEQQLFLNFQMKDAPLTWEKVVEQGLRHRISDVVHAALRVYTIQDLEKVVAGEESCQRR